MTENITRSASVFVRHSPDCPDKKRGTGWRKCRCRKSLLLYDGATKRQQKISAKTRSWEKAEDAAREWLEQFDPVKVELRRLKAEKETKTVRIEQAVAAFLADMIFRLGDNGSVERARTLLGHVDPNTCEVERNGKLFDWLEKQTPRPIFICDITPAHLSAWRAAWKYGSDLTASISWTQVKTFFKFCKAQGWVTANPASELQRPQVAKGNRTATFSDDQYDAILAAAKGNQRLETFIELLRWSGMALIDAVQFESKSLDADGVLRYARIKTGTLATVQLPAHVITLLRAVEGGQPFRRAGIALQSCLQDWRRELKATFSKAGIKQVKTDVGMRAPHPHMLRDTCAVWYLRHGMGLYGVAKILGHSDPTVTAQKYLPFVTELEKAHIAENVEVLAAAKPRHAGNVVNIGTVKTA